MKSLIKRNREIIEVELYETSRWKYFSPAIYAQYKVLVPVLLKYATGSLLDMGCGLMPYEHLLIDKLDSYDGVDIFPRTKKVKFIADIQNMPEIPDHAYDTVIAIEVLEHVKNPVKAVMEANRVLKPGGKFILSVPHLSRVHDAPNDYYRFTKYGIGAILEKGGFEIISIDQKGGVFSFVGHQISTLILCLVWGIPVLKDIIFFFNSFFITRLFYGLDRIFGKDGILALGYVIIAKSR